MISEANSPKLTSILKSILFWMLFLVFLFLSGTQITALFPVSWHKFTYGISGTLSAFFATWIFLKIEKKTFADYELVWQRDTLFKFLKGIVLGTAIFFVIIVILVSFTELHIERNPNPWDPWSAFWFLAIIPLALMEEIVFRAYPFIKLNRVFGLRITQIIVSMAFALYHIINGWNVQIAFLGPATWAFVFGLSAIWSNGIAVPTGIHVALNLIQELLGMRENEGSIWLFKRSEDIPATVNSSETVGIIIQVLVLLSAVVATELYLRGGKQNNR